MRKIPAVEFKLYSINTLKRFFWMVLFLNTIIFSHAQNTLNLTGLSSSSVVSTAYSLRLLSSAYTGPLFRVFNGTSYYDVYPDGANAISLNSTISASSSTYNEAVKANTSTLFSSLFTGVSQMFIAVWYDQSGNNRHVLQSNNTARPKIVQNGVLTKNVYGNVAAWFNYAFMQTSSAASWLSGHGYSINSVCEIDGGSSRMFVGVDCSCNNVGLHYGDCNSTTFCLNHYYNDAGFTITASTYPRIRTAVKYNGSGGSAAWLNGNSLGTNSLPSANLNSISNALNIGSGQNQSPSWHGYMSEVIILQSELTTTERQNLELNQLSYYNINNGNLNVTWNGGTSTDWTNASNWSPNLVPTASTSVLIPSTGITNFPILTDVSINSGTNVSLLTNAKLTVNGVLTNNGTLTLNSGATLVQGSSSTLAGSGTYNVKQAITGSGGSTPNGRFWYLGAALSDASSTALLSSTGNQLWQWNESSFAYAPVTSGQTLTHGKSYVLRSGQTSETINFSGTSLSNGTVTVFGLTRTGTTQTYRGCHLISNPYPSYLDWTLVGKMNVSTTMYVRTASGNTLDVLDSYNATSNVGTNNAGVLMNRYIAPMQGFWVKVSADNLTGSLTMSNSMRSHQASGSGLRSTPQDFPAFLRLNMLDGQNKDQVILLMSPDAAMSFDNFDSEKMAASGYAQFYSMVSAKKLVINGMKNVKAKTSIPLTLEMPSSKTYIFQAEEFNIEDGLILLEDKQEGVIQDLTINPTYSFFGEAGTNASRFVVHFQLANAPVLVGGPMELESLGSDELTSDNIQIVSNNQGTIIIRLDEGFKPEGSIRIFDASGRLVERTDLNDQETTIKLNEQAGLYFVEVAAGKLMVKKKIVIE